MSTAAKGPDGRAGDRAARPPERGETRLERAMQAWLAFRDGRAGDKAALLAAHPDLADLLEAMFADETAPAAAGPVDGAQVLADFRLLREVGRGGMGVVYEARQLSLDRRVALKVLLGDVTARPAALARFRREALTLARLDHEHVVRIHDVGETEGQHWLAMEFVDGDPLDRRLASLRATGHRGDSLRALVEVIADVADALHHAHAAGVVHRDVKPSNILLREGGGAVLTDFGLARDASSPSVTALGAVAGTPHYMSPEQVLGRGSELDARSDVFSLGATLYECIALRPPFDGATVEQVLHRIVHRDPVDPRRRTPGAPADLTAIVLKALEKNPADRYPNARLFADDLRAFLALRPVQARPLSTPTRVRRWIRREPLKAALAGTLSAGGLLGIVFLLRLPDIRAGALAQRERQYEDAIVDGFLARTGTDRAAAYACFERALALAPERTEPLINLCLAIKAFEGAVPALAELDRRAGDRRDDADLLRLRAALLRWAARTAEAEAIERGLPPPRTPTALWMAAGTAAVSDDPATRARALADASLAVRIAPAPRLLLHTQWAACAQLVGDEASRREAAQALLALWPEHPVALHYAAACLMQSDPARAAELVRSALARGLDDRYGQYNLAAALILSGRVAEAIAPLRAACAANPGEERFRRHLVEKLGELGDTAAQLAECERWHAEAPASMVARRMLAQCLSAVDEHERAIELARAGADALPDDHDVQYDLAVILDHAGRPADARDQLLVVLRLSPAHERAHARLLGVLNDLADPDAMLAEMARWANARPDDAEAWATFARGVLAVDRADLLPRALEAAERADYLARGENAGYLSLRADALSRIGDEAGAARLRDLAKARAK